MDFPEKTVYTELIAELKSRAYHFQNAGHVAPVHYDWDRGQYVVDGDLKEHPFNRGAIFFLFGEMPYELHSNNMRRGTIPLTVTCVQDKYVDSRDGSASQARYLKLLEWKYLVNDVLDMFRGSCFTPLNMMSISTDHENRNYHVEKINYELKFNLKRNRLPLTADSALLSADSTLLTADQT